MKNGYPDGDLVETVVAIANIDGGELYLGVEGNGEITGLAKKHVKAESYPLKEYNWPSHLHAF